MTELENWGAPSKEHETLLKHDDYELKHTPLLPLNSKELLRVTKTLFKSGLPTSIGFICGFASGIVCLRFTGKYGTPIELAGASLGFTWAAVFCVGILASINQGFNVLASQLFGAKNYRDLGILFQRNLCVLSIVVIPLLLSLCFADSILIGIGLDPEVSMNTGIYLKCAIPSVVALGIFECLKCYLIAQNCFYIQPIIQGSLAIVHIFWCYLFVDIFEMPVAGIAIAKSITDVTSAIVLWLCIKYGGFGKAAWIPWDRACLEKWWSYFKQAMTLGANLYVEWISLEVSLFVIGMLNNEYMLGAHGVAITVMSLFFMFPLGNSISMQAYIGNAMGEGSQHKAQKFMVAGLGLNMIMTIINIIIMLTFREAIAEIFTSDDQTKDILQNMIFIFSFAHFADTNTNHLSGVLRTVGNEWEVLVSFFVCYVLIGINCEWIFGVALGYGYQAIWISMTLGMYIMGSWAIRKLKNLDWEKEVAKIRKGVYVEMV